MVDVVEEASRRCGMADERETGPEAAALFAEIEETSPEPES
jgi:hypothetical protein